MAVSVDRSEVRAGETVRGHVEGGEGTELALLRLEISPLGTVTTRLAVTEANGMGEFALELPASTVPTARGRECALEYVVRTTPRERQRPIDIASVIVPGRLETPHLQESSPYADRMIARYEARRFHIELSEADVQGGGQVAGRVHLHPGKTAEGLVLTCRCLESWRTNGRSIVHNRRQPPLWRIKTIWEESVTLDWEPGQTWSAFRVALPEALPPAVEARSIAWRYEVEARLRVRLGMYDTAVTTPVGFEIVAV